MTETKTLPRTTEIVIVPAESRIYSGNVRKVRKDLRGLVADKRNIVVDLRHVVHLDCSGAAALLDLYRRLRACDGHLRLTGLQPAVRLFFELLRLDSVLDIHSAPFQSSLPVAA